MTTEPEVLRGRDAAAPALLGVLLTVAIAVTVVLPPKYMSIYMVAGGAAAAAAALLRDRRVLRNRWFLAIFGFYLAAAAFCFMGTLPIHRKSDIDLEFLKYGVYTAGFLVGFVVLRDRRKNRRFAGTVMALVFVLFAILAVTGGPQFRVDQSWPIYPPDQNNSATMILVLAVGTVAAASVYGRMAMLFALAVFVAFVESRAGLIIVGLMLLLQFRLAPKPAAIIVLLASAGIWTYMSYGPINPQTKLILAAQSAVGAFAGFINPHQPVAPEAAKPQLPPASQPLPEAGSEPGSAVPEAAKPQLPPASQPPLEAGSEPGSAVPAVAKPQLLPANRPLLEVGSASDSARIGIYKRALALSAEVFPNLIGLGDAGVVERLNSPPIARNVVFQHAHNFLLQSYLAYGLLATISLVMAVIGMAALAIRRRAWSLLASLILIAALGMLESLTSDIRVLTILSIFLGGNVAVVLAGPREIETTHSERITAS